MTNEELAVCIQEGDTALLPKLWEQVERFMWQQSLRYYHANRDGCTKAGVLPQDLCQCSYLALLDAVAAFDGSRGYSFLAWLKFPLKTAFAAALGIRGHRRDALNNCVSLDEPVGDDGDATFLDTLPDKSSAAPFDEAVDTMDNDILRGAFGEVISALPDIERDVVTRRFYGGQTFKQIAIDYGVTQARIGAIQTSAFNRLRKNNRRVYSKEEQDTAASVSYRTGGLGRFRLSWTSSVEKAFEVIEEARRYG